MKYTKETYKAVARLNKQGFNIDGVKDTYSKWKNLRDYIEDNPKFSGLLLKKVKGKIVGYLFWSFDGVAMRTNRRAVDKACRGKGYGVLLTARLIKKAAKWGFPYQTYAANWNLASINSSIKCGCKIKKIGKRWTHLEAGNNILED